MSACFPRLLVACGLYFTLNFRLGRTWSPRKHASNEFHKARATEDGMKVSKKT